MTGDTIRLYLLEVEGYRVIKCGGGGKVKNGDAYADNNVNGGVESGR
jgi:hypothetical protein